MSKPITAAIVALIGIVFICAGGLTVLFGAAGTAACAVTDTDPTASTAMAATANPSPVPRTFSTVTSMHAVWTATQVENAAVIVAVGANENIPPRGWVIAVATAMQESGLRNLGNLGARNDHDSLGLFQQRPSQGWGTSAQIMDPVYAASKFYTGLVATVGWQAMPLTQAAQAVQRSTFPTAYAKWEPDASQLVSTVTGLVDLGIEGACAAAAALPSGWTLPLDTPPAVVTAITWALRQLGTPYHWGGDCTASRSGNPARQCDCSSLVQQAYRAAGITLPRTADQQSRHGQRISDPDQLEPGDLIFIIGAAPGSRQHPGHVGMYLGDGLVIEAPEAGETVKIVGYARSWITTLVTIRREVPHVYGGS